MLTWALLVSAPVSRAYSVFRYDKRGTVITLEIVAVSSLRDMTHSKGPRGHDTQKKKCYTKLDRDKDEKIGENKNERYKKEL